MAYFKLNGYDTNSNIGKCQLLFIITLTQAFA